jgi:hypothetical protein
MVVAAAVDTNREVVTAVARVRDPTLILHTSQLTHFPGGGSYGGGGGGYGGQGGGNNWRQGGGGGGYGGQGGGYGGGGMDDFP